MLGHHGANRAWEGFLGCAEKTEEWVTRGCLSPFFGNILSTWIWNSTSQNSAMRVQCLSYISETAIRHASRQFDMEIRPLVYDRHTAVTVRYVILRGGARSMRNVWDRSMMHIICTYVCRIILFFLLYVGAVFRDEPIISHPFLEPWTVFCDCFIDIILQQSIPSRVSCVGYTVESALSLDIGSMPYFIFPPQHCIAFEPDSDTVISCTCTKARVCFLRVYRVDREKCGTNEIKWAIASQTKCKMRKFWNTNPCFKHYCTNFPIARMAFLHILQFIMILFSLELDFEKLYNGIIHDEDEFETIPLWMLHLYSLK